MYTTTEDTKNDEKHKVELGEDRQQKSILDIRNHTLHLQPEGSSPLELSPRRGEGGAHRGQL